VQKPGWPVIPCSWRTPKREDGVLSQHGFLSPDFSWSCAGRWGFVCPLCKQRKDNKKKNSATCWDCFEKANLHKEGKETKEEQLLYREKNVEMREEHVKSTCSGESTTRAGQKESKGVGHSRVGSGKERSPAGQERESKHTEEVRLLKRRREEDAPAPGQKRFCELGPRRKQELVSAAVSNLSFLSRGAPEEILQCLNVRMFGHRDDHEREFLLDLKTNISEFCHVYLPSHPEKCRIAGLFSQGMTLEESSKLTGVSVSSIAWGRKEIENNSMKQTRVCVYALFLHHKLVNKQNTL
jgi:hypothetical protein